MTTINSFKSAIKLITPPIILKVAKKISKKPNYAWSEIFKILQNQQKQGLKINTVIDIGASNGMWSEEVMPIYPQASYVLVEANRYHENDLKAFVNRFQNAQYVLAAAGDSLGEIYFDSTDPFGGASHEKSEKLVSVPVVTIDSVVKERNLKGPFILKLDTHGFEVPIFEGANETLKHTDLIIVEVYNFQIAKNSLLFFEMCQFLAGKGFRPMALADIMYRPKDNFLWQLDLVFVRDTRNEFKDNSY
jgi:FkbM family methyltransferase